MDIEKLTNKYMKVYDKNKESSSLQLCLSFVRIKNGRVRCVFYSAAKTRNKANYNQDCLFIYETNYVNTSQSEI